MKEPRWPGWYRDSDDPTLLRHWNGRHWEGRRRHLPSWSIATAELRVLDPAAPVLGAQPDGPASPAAIPAAASPTGHTTHPRRLPVPPSGPHGGPLGAADLFPQRAATPTIRRWVLPPRRAVAGALVLALLVVTISSALSGAGRRRSSAPFGANSTFAHVANADCAAVMGAVRPATMTTASYKTVGGAAAELDRLAGVGGCTHGRGAVGDRFAGPENPVSGYRRDRRQAGRRIRQRPRALGLHPRSAGCAGDRPGALTATTAGAT